MKGQGDAHMVHCWSNKERRVASKGSSPAQGIVDGDLDKRFALFPFRGFSMFPFLRPGDMLVVKKGPHIKPKIGSVVLRRNNHPSSSSVLISHRIVRQISNVLFITKGDNLTRPDPGICPLDDVVGHVLLIVRKGRMVPLYKGPNAWIERPIAYFSRINGTPGILVRRLKRVLGLHY